MLVLLSLHLSEELLDTVDAYVLLDITTCLSTLSSVDRHGVHA